MALAAAQAATGRFEESRESLLESVDLTTDAEATLRVQLIGACAGVEQVLGHHEEAHARLVAALAELLDTSSSEAVELMIHLARGRLLSHGLRGHARLGGPCPRRRRGARALADRSEPGRARGGDGVRGPDPEKRRPTARTPLTLVDALSDHALTNRLDAVTTLSAADLYLHRYDDAATHARRGLAIARAAGRGELVPFLVPVLVTVLHTSGRVDEAAELLGEAVDAARLSGNAESLGWNLLSRAYVAVVAGDLELALGAAQESVEVTHHLDDRLVYTNARWAFASALLELGEPESAIEVLATAAGGEELPRIPVGWRAHYLELMTRCWLDFGRFAEGQAAAARAAATAERVGLKAATAMADRAAAAVALVAGDTSTATDRALSAAVAAEEIGARVDGARARTLAGRALAAAGEQGRAVAELEGAARVLEHCGARRYREEAQHELRKLGRRFGRRSRATRPDGDGVETLTRRELEVAGLVVERHTNPEIARALVLSEKTVETHMRNIFRKLQVTSRADVARAVENTTRR